MKMFLNSIFFVFLVKTAVCGSVSIHYLKPPKLDTENYGRRVLCHRPVRKDAPRIGIERQHDTYIMHNYGHGGSGWTLAPGCVQYLLEKFESDLAAEKDAPIVIVGAGIIGLLTAYRLIKFGYTDITIIADRFDDLTSHKAGGFLAPSTLSVQEVDEKMQLFINDICYDAYRFYAEIAQGNNPDFAKEGARCMPVYLMREDDRLAAYEDRVMQRPEDVIVDFATGKRYEMKVYHDAIFMDTDILMASLTAFLKEKIAWINRRIDSFDEIDSPYIFNCAGLGAHDLNQDDSMISVQGHLLMLNEQNCDDMKYMISLFVSNGVTESGHKVKRSMYMFPKHVPGTPKSSVGVLGGTFIEGADAATPNEREFELMIERARDFFGV